MTALLLFAAGFALGAAVTVWALGRSTVPVSQRLEEEFRVLVPDPRVDGLPW